MPFGINILNTPAKIEKLPIQEPLQQSGINQLFQQGLQNYNPDMTEQYAQRKFQRDIVPAIAESFTRGGSNRNSSAFQGALGAGAADLAGRLAQHRYETGLNQLKFGLTPQYEYLYQPEQPGLAQTATQSAVGALAEKTPDLVSKALEALGNRGKAQQQAQTSQTTSSGNTASEQAAQTTEQILNNLSPKTQQKPLTAADLVPPSTGNIAQDAFNNPSLTPFTRQALAKTQIQQTPESAKVLEKLAQPSKGWQVAGNLGSNALQTAGWVAAGVPAPIAAAGGLLKSGYDIYKTLKG